MFHCENYYFDLDGVVLDFFSGFKQFCEGLGFNALTTEPAFYDMRDAFDDLKDPTSLINAFQHSDAFTKLSPYSDAVTLLRSIRLAGGRVTFITSCGDTAPIRSARVNNVESALDGLFDDLIVLPYTSSKATTLRSLPSGLFVDDDAKQVREALDTHQTCFLRHRSYNANSTLPRLHNLVDISPMTVNFAYG